MNIFEEVGQKVRNSFWIIWIFIAAVCMLCVGAYFFFEDTYSSYTGIVQIQSHFDIRVVTFPIGLYFLAITPQIGQVVFGYLWVITRKMQYAFGFLCFIFVDMAFDVWYRSNEQLLDNLEVALITILLTLVIYTLCSEIFVTLGGGLVFELFPDFTLQLKIFRSRMKSIKYAKKTQPGTKIPPYNGKQPVRQNQRTFSNKAKK